MTAGKKPGTNTGTSGGIFQEVGPKGAFVQTIRRCQTINLFLRRLPLEARGDP